VPAAIEHIILSWKGASRSNEQYDITLAFALMLECLRVNPQGGLVEVLICT